MIILNENIVFPPVSMANQEGLLAIGGDLSVNRLLLAYRQGIFPWYSSNSPILWWSPDPRMVLFPENLRISKSMRTLLKKEVFTVTFNKAFGAVVEECANAPRSDQEGTWITLEMQNAYLNLHKKGIAKSVEIWQNDILVGGLYGVDLGHVFCGESMFTKVSNASKYGFIKWVNILKQRGCKLIDCQVYTQHLESLGAEEIDREYFLKILQASS